MTISDNQEIIVREILTESLNNWVMLFEEYNLFTSDEFNDKNGDIGWEILNHITENDKKYRKFILDLSEKPEIQREIGHYVHHLINKRIDEYSTF